MHINTTDKIDFVINIISMIGFAGMFFIMTVYLIEHKTVFADFVKSACPEEIVFYQ